MRINLTCLILLMAFLQITLAANAQKISLSKKNAPLTEVFKELKKQSGYGFMINKERIKIAKPVTITVNGEELIDVLDKCFKDQPFTYRVEDKMIIVVDKRPEQNRMSLLDIDVKGRILDENGKPMMGASVGIKGTNRRIVSDVNGEFAFSKVDEKAVLVISYIGYEVKEVAAQADLGDIKMTINTGKLDEVSVVSTGYQSIPKERATGSFVLIDSALLNRRVSTNILGRLEGVTSGLIFNKNNQNPNSSDITIRGISTIFANDQPLVILDNFPYQGDLSNINPNDVASITILKDAAAASIWGVRAGNGVIVITSKKGKLGQPLSINISSNVTVINKPNLFYTPQLTSSEFINTEKFLYDQGYYWSIEDGYSAISPVLEVLKARHESLITKEDSVSRINSLIANDVRRDMGKYLYRKAINQQYQFNVSGSGENNTFYISGGYDKNLQNLNTDSYDRLTLKLNNTVSLFKNRLVWSNNVSFTNSKSLQNNDPFIPKTPYELLADKNGTPLSAVKDLRKTYIDTAGNGALLDWQYVPLNENQSNLTTALNDYRFSTDLTYKISKPINLSTSYLFQKGTSTNEKIYSQDSYYTRNFINSYSQLNTLNNEVISPVGIGQIVTKNNNSYRVNTGRLQLNYDQFFLDNHHITAAAGFEISDYNGNSDSYTLYGYDPETGTNKNDRINPSFDYPQYYGYGTGRISPNVNNSGNIDRNRSYYFNFSYSYKSRYIFSGSARRDESNLFGVKTNQKGVPLWSSGIAWLINSEPFYNLDWLPFLKLRSTFGYNGNVDKTATAFLTGRLIGINSFGAPNLVILNPPNPSLRWEKIAVSNIGIDFATKGNRFSGSLEYYIKNSSDLMANAPIAQQSGVLQFKGNAADMVTKGFDLTINTANQISAIKWNTAFIFNYVKNKVTNYKLNPGSNLNIVANNFSNPFEGYPLYSIFSYRSTKLDENGNPQGYLNGALSKDYAAMLSSTDRSNLQFEGSATPTYFGSIINNWNYSNFELSVGISYSLGYFFKKPSLNYTNLFSGTYQQADFGKRWQKSGDENSTFVPSMIYYPDQNRDSFYNNSESLIEKANNIRLQDVKLCYTLKNQRRFSIPFSMLQIYIYANNIGILWKANKSGLDPDSPYLPPAPSSISFGLKANF